MPIYEYYCPSCDAKFQRLLPMSQADDGVCCPEGHDGSRRLISTFASFAKSSDGTTTAIGGNSCASCAATSCGSCGI
ncbi:MAG: zinc ribbon domain-containing protein [Chloroflexi bacterium]|nr:zinc ribbon domain-containing protein [Chloroflexota bacterium]